MSGFQRRQRGTVTRAPFPAFAGVWGSWGAGTATHALDQGTTVSMTLEQQKARLAKQITDAALAGDFAKVERLKAEAAKLATSQYRPTNQTWTLTAAPAGGAPAGPLPAASSTADPGASLPEVTTSPTGVPYTPVAPTGGITSTPWYVWAMAAAAVAVAGYAVTR